MRARLIAARRNVDVRSQEDGWSGRRRRRRCEAKSRRQIRLSRGRDYGKSNDGRADRWSYRRLQSELQDRERAGRGVRLAFVDRVFALLRGDVRRLARADDKSRPALRRGHVPGRNQGAQQDAEKRNGDTRAPNDLDAAQSPHERSG